MSRKPRSDSKLDALSEEQHVTLAEWLTIENVSYADAKARVLDQFGVSTSVAALQSFFSRFAAPWKYARAAGEADSFADLMEGKFDAATIKKAKQLAFDAMSGPRPDLKAAKALLKIVGDSAKLSLAQEKLSLDARKVKILEAKAAQADAAKAVTSDESLTPEQQLLRYRQIFGG
jgi:hypothetical protein